MTYADDRTAKVELSSQCRVIPIDKSYVIIDTESDDPATQSNVGANSVYGSHSMHGGGQTVYENQKTIIGKATPSYYP